MPSQAEPGLHNPQVAEVLEQHYASKSHEHHLIGFRMFDMSGELGVPSSTAVPRNPALLQIVQISPWYIHCHASWPKDMSPLVPNTLIQPLQLIHPTAPNSSGTLAPKIRTLAA